MDINDLEKKLGIDGLSADEQMELVDALQKSAQTKLEIANQETIGKSTQVVIQGLKKIKSDLETRFSQLNATIESKASSLRDGKDGKDGKNGKDGLEGKQGLQGSNGQDGRDGRDGLDGTDGISVTSARIDFDGSLIIGLSSGVELNVGEVVAPDLAESIKVITNGGGTSQFVLDTLTSLQTQINTLIPSQTGNSGKFLTTNGTSTSWASIAGGGLSYQGTWNASTNTPTLVSSTGVNGYYYITATAGSTNLDGITDWQIGDWLLFNGTVWQKIDQSNLVTSVNGYTGTVVLTQTDVSGTASLTTTQTLTNKTLTSPIINEILDANGNEILGLSPTASATDFLTVKNGIGVGVPLHIYADGSSSNIGLHIQPKGTGLVTISDGTDFNKGIRFRSSSSSTSAVTLIDAVSTAGRVVTLPDATTTLVGRDTTDTLTNKTLTSPTLTSPVLGTPASGNLANCTFPTLNQNTTGTAAGLSGSQTANYVYAAPNGSSGTASFRALVAADIPTLNQNTTGSAATLTTGRTLAITGDLAYTSPSFNGSANVTAAGTLATVNANVGSFTNATLTVNGKGLITAASSGTAPVTSVTATSPVASTGGATPVISMPAATTTVSGYLTSTDWTTFNNKGSGTITSVTGTAPVVSSGGTTPAISMAAATTSVSGYLTSTDWNTFNGKGSGTVTNVSALTLGTTGTDLSSTVATSTTTPVITLNVPTASATNRGALSSADWTTFNNKGSGTVTSVSGTSGRITSTGGATPVLDLTSGVATAGTTGSASLIPVVTIDTYGRVTSITTAANPQGTVTSVTATSPVASSGGATPAISLSSGYGDTLNPYASKTANYVLASPNGTAGVPTFRALVATDVPTLNQNTTGTAANVTGTVAIANGGTGSTTAATALTALGAYPSANPSGYTSNTGTVTSVGGTGTVNGLTLTGTVTTSGNLTLGGTLSSIANSALTNSSVTVGTTAISLGASSLTLGGLTSVAVTQDPTTSLQLATKQYVDTTAQGLSAKTAVYVATTANITLSGEQTIDGFTTSASRVLVKNQTTTSQNGIYVSSASTWTRATDADTWAELISAFVFVSQGTIYGDTGWTCTVDAGGTLGTTAVTWVQFSGAGTYTAGTGLTLTGTQFSITNVGTASTYGSATQTPVLTTNAQGQVSSVTNTTITPAIGSVTGLATGVATFLATPSSANMAAMLTDETGTGSNVFATSPTLVTPILGTPQSGNFSTGTFTWPTFNQNTTGTAANITASSNSTLTTLSALSLPGSQVSGNISGNAANVTGTVAVANGGTGLTATPTNGQIDIGNGTGFTRSTLTAGTGVTITNASGSITIASSVTPVTSVTGTSPVVSSGGTTPAISLASGYGDTQNPYASKTANYILAAPNGTAGAPTFRAVVAADIPTLNQNTTGTASNVTGTVAIANGGSGQTTAQLGMNAFAGAVTSGSYLRGNGTNVVMSTIQAADVPTLNQNTTGTASNVTGTVAIANGGTGQTTQQAALTALSGTQTSGQYLRSNGTNTLLSAIQAADVPTLNQNTTGSAATLTTARAIYGNNFNGSAALTQVIASTYGGTGNGFAKLSGPATSEKTFTLPNASATILTDNAAVTVLQGGTGATTASGARTNLGLVIGTDVLAPTGSAASLTSFPTFNQNTTGTASNVTGTVAIANGGTGQTTASAGFNALSPVTSTGDLIIGNGVNSATRLAIGTNGYVLTSNGTTATWSAASGGGATITNDTTTSTNVYPLFAAATSGSLTTVYTGNAKYLYKPSTGELTVPAPIASNGIVVNSKTVGTSYTIASGNSAMSAGPITLSSGVSVTISSGSRWVVL